MRPTVLIAVLAALAVVAIAVLDVTSLTRAKPDIGSSAAIVASKAEDAYFQTGQTDEAALAASTTAHDLGVALLDFKIEEGGAATAKVSKKAGSILAGRLPYVSSYYELTASATSGPRAGAPPTTSTTSTTAKVH